VAAGLALVRFVGNGSPVGEVFVVDAAGEFHQLTGLGSASSLGASLPVWSPDGRQVAFGPPKVGAGPDRFLSVIGADGSGERPLAALGDEFGLPFGWSPDGASLLFFDIDAADGPAMWLADVASGEVRHLGVGQLPRWLPDGHRISFKRGVEGRDPADPRALTEVIYVMSLDRGEEAELAVVSDAIWSPDGTAVLLQHATGDLLLADADGSNPRDLVRGWAPVWSPDGSRIVFTYDHNHDGVPLLAAVDRNGRALWSGVPGSSPTWSPDGSRLAVEVVFPDLEVKVMDAATGDVLWQTAGAEPAWGP
jgi:Tol biopolymer transport system component